jgi:hypothetical protein
MYRPWKSPLFINLVFKFLIFKSKLSHFILSIIVAARPGWRSSSFNGRMRRIHYKLRNLKDAATQNSRFCGNDKEELYIMKKDLQDQRN